MNLFSALRAAFPAAAGGISDAVAIEIDGEDRAWTWRDLDRATGRIANLLASLDLEPGARVAVQVEKSVEALVLYLGVLRAGCAFIPLNSAYKADEIAYFLGDAEPAVFVCTPALFPSLSRIAFAAGTTFVFSLGADRTGTLLDRAAQFADAHEPVPRAADDLAAILYTSGTTGRSKGAMLTHGNLLSNAEVLHVAWGWRTARDGGDVLIHALPIFHVHGLFVASHGALLAGARMIWLATFDPARVVARLPDATVFMGVPTLYVRLLQEPALDRAACASMRLFVSGSAPLLLDTFERWQERTGHTILERYGMSETVMLTSNPYRPDDGDRRGGTVGRPLPGVELRITGEGGHEVATGEPGSIEVRGPNVFQGYWKQPEKTAAELSAEGWFTTGDVGRRDGEGYVTIVGRSKDLVITGGYNVYPAEIEGLLNDLPGVAESAVIGVPHPDFGEAVVAVVVPRQGAALDGERIRATVKSRLANFKVPKRVFVTDELPRNAMGKVQKQLLRERHRELFSG